MVDSVNNQNLAGVQSLMSVDVKSMDLETAMWAVQMQRATLLEDQLKTQMKGVADRNAEINRLNNSIAQLNAAAANMSSDATKPEGVKSKNDVLGMPVGSVDQAAYLEECAQRDPAFKTKLDNFKTEAAKRGLDATKFNETADAIKNEAKASQDLKTAMDDFKSAVSEKMAQAPTSLGNVAGSYGINVNDSRLVNSDGKYTKEGINALISQLKTKLDERNSDQQQDMLKLQTLMNRRNEAFDLVTNFLKKAADSRNSIIGNMR